VEDRLGQVVGERDLGCLLDNLGQHLEAGVGVQAPGARRGHGAVLVEAQPGDVRDEVADRRAGWAGRLVPLDGALLDGDQGGVGGEHLGHRGQVEGAILVAVGVQHGAPGVDDRDGRVVDRPTGYRVQAVHAAHGSGRVSRLVWLS
jgi:hypothetical protein